MEAKTAEIHPQKFARMSWFTKISAVKPKVSLLLQRSAIVIASLELNAESCGTSSDILAALVAMQVQAGLYYFRKSSFAARGGRHGVGCPRFRAVVVISTEDRFFPGAMDRTNANTSKKKSPCTHFTWHCGLKLRCFARHPLPSTLLAARLARHELLFNYKKKKKNN